MMKSTKEIKREAKHLFRLCFIGERLDEDRVRSVLQGILGSKRRGSLPLAGQFQRLVSLDRLKHTAKVESAVPLSAELQANVQASLVRSYGPELTTSFVENSALIGGMRITVASDVYDGSIKAGLAALEKSF
ncbi:MAG TPA: F0F1 ATP synthase subunit delta [Pyrinomonadaceae bacterium]